MYNWVRIQLYILHYSIQHYTLHTIRKHKKGPRITPEAFHCKSKKHINYETKYFIKNEFQNPSATTFRVATIGADKASFLIAYGLLPAFLAHQLLRLRPVRDIFLQRTLHTILPVIDGLTV